MPSSFLFLRPLKFCSNKFRKSLLNLFFNFYHHKRICEILKWTDLYPCQTYVWFVLFSLSKEFSIIYQTYPSNVEIMCQFEKYLPKFFLFSHLNTNCSSKGIKMALIFLQKLAAKCVKIGGSYFKNCTKSNYCQHSLQDDFRKNF